MKFRYIVRTFVDAESPLEALKLAKKTEPQEVFLDMDLWKLEDFRLTEKKEQVGFSIKDKNGKR